MKPEFEERLRNARILPVPSAWRADILGKARAAVPVEAEARSWWRELLWPCPQAWAALGGLCVISLIINLATADSAGPKTMMAEQGPSASKQTVTALKKEYGLSIRLTEALAKADADRPPTLAPRPHSERARVTVIL